MSFAQDLHAPAGDDPVEEMLALCLESDPAERRARLDELCTKHPEHSGALRRRWDVLASMGLVDDQGGAQPEFPDRLGDFDLLERLGGGGMGVVFLARQRSLARDVALKLIRPEQLYFPRARERFKREAEAVARLAHPGIVPIHLVGEERGVPFYAMERVEGCTLAEVLLELAGRAPESLGARDLLDAVRARLGTSARGVESVLHGSWVDACASIAAQIAAALDHAHSRGVLHRDVKPSNVMLTLEGRAKLVDFGLTVVAGDDAQTRTGAQIGTLAYMSPEQVRGRGDLDARVDVYGLGVTLYELLTLQVPYRGADPLATQSSILEGRPDSIRARNRKVGADLETVCVVAMEREPARRYATAAALRNDLERVLARRPIHARPPGPWIRAARFAQRRPGLVASLGTALVLAIAAPTLMFIQERTHSRALSSALSRESAARNDAEQQRAAASLAESSARAARDEPQRQAATAEQSLTFLTGLFSDTSPEQRTDDTTTAFKILQRGVDRIRTSLEDQPAARMRLQASIGTIWSEHGHFEEAIPLLEQALATQREHPEYFLPPDANLPSQLAFAWLGKRDIERARPYLRELIAQRLDSSEAHDVAYALNSIAAEARLDRDEARLDAAVAQLRELWTSTQEPEVQQRYAAAVTAQGQLAADRGDLERAEELITSALALVREAGGEESPDLFNVYVILAGAQRKRGRLSEADASYAQGLRIARSIYEIDGAVVGRTLLNWAILRAERGDLAGARELAEEAERVTADDMGVDSSDHGQALYAVGRIALRSGDFERAYAPLEQAADILAMSGDAQDRVTRGYAFGNLAECSEHAREFDRAREQHAKAIELLAGIDAADHVLNAMLQLAGFETRRGRPLEAASACEAALTYAEGHAGESPEMTRKLYLQAARAYESAGDDSKAQEFRRRAEGP